jgi:hypothetical protein
VIYRWAMDKVIAQFVFNIMFIQRMDHKYLCAMSPKWFFQPIVLEKSCLRSTVIRNGGYNPKMRCEMILRRWDALYLSKIFIFDWKMIITQVKPAMYISQEITDP